MALDLDKPWLSPDDDVHCYRCGSVLDDGFCECCGGNPEEMDS